MSQPNDAPAFSTELCLIESVPEALRVSNRLADLLSEARTQYAWGAESASKSQKIIAKLENETARRLADLHGDNAQWIVQEVSRWGGNNRNAIRAIADASPEQKQTFAELIGWLLIPSSTERALRELTKQPGLGLVMASKIYRFCCPHVGAAVDRHSSYFFNSLSARDETGKLRPCSQFMREWANGRHRASRLAAYADSKLGVNLKEY